MSTHTNHQHIVTSGLADECPRCAEQAANPWYELDRETLYMLIRRTLDGNLPRSEVESLAMSNIAETINRAGRLYAAAPERVVSRLMEFTK